MLGPRPLIPASGQVMAPRASLRLAEPHAQMGKAQQLKDRLSTRIDEAISYAYPGRDGINKDVDDAQIYDDTAMLAAPEFASRIQQGVLPNFARWATFVAGILVPEEERPALATALAQIDSYLFTMIGNSNFPIEVNEAIMDVAIGTGAIRIDEMPGPNPFVARAMPLRGLSFCIGPDGKPDPIYEKRKVQLAHIKIHWPDAVLPAGLTLVEMFEEVDAVEVWQRDWSKPNETVYRQSVILPAYGNVVIFEETHRGEGALPIIIFRWSKAAGEGWGRGPLFNCLPSMRKCNFAERALLDHTDMALGGIWSMEDDGVVNTDTVRLDPGTIVPRAAGSAPLANVAPAGDFRMAEYMLEQSRMSIRKALFTEQLGNPNKTPMSATEVTQRMTELARAIGSPFSRMIVELVFPAIARFVRILKDRKLITLPQVDGKEIRLVSTSPLAMAQNFEDIDRIERYLASMGGLFGQQALNVVVKMEEVAHTLGDKYQVPGNILRSKPESAQIIQQVAASVGQGGQNGEATPGDGAAGPPSGPGPGA